MLDPLCKHLEVETSMYEGIVDSCKSNLCVVLCQCMIYNGTDPTMSYMLAVVCVLHHALNARCVE